MKACLLFYLFITTSLISRAQSDGLVADQNPAYRVSQAKYTAVADSLQLTMNTTVQQTYKAFDWYTAKLERREERRNERRERRLYRIQARGSYLDPAFGFYDPYYRPYRYAFYRNRYHCFRW